MPRNEEGEFELILGNKQLLSVFFIVVALLGFFFTMGYVVGRSSAPVVAADTSTRPRVETTKPIVVEPAPPPVTPVEPVTHAEAAKPVATTPQQKAEPAAKPEPLLELTAKADAAKKAKETAKEAKAEAAAEAKAKAKEAKQEKAKVEAKGKAPATAEVASGKTYLQLSATKRAEADTYVDVLRKKGFAAMAAPVPNSDGLFRVLVGPVSDGDINKTRSDLQGAGFPGDKALRKKF